MIDYFLLWSQILIGFGKILDIVEEGFSDTFAKVSHVRDFDVSVHLSFHTSIPLFYLTSLGGTYFLSIF
jgi:hypothetical protein